MRYQFSPVEHLNKVIMAFPQFQKLLYLVMVFPSLISWNKNQPRTLKMKKTRKRSAPTFTRDGSEKMRVSINF
jgi:hypothetical protein